MTYNIMQNCRSTCSRREMILRSAQAAAWVALAGHCAPLFAAPDKWRFKLGGCDWSIGKMCDLAALRPDWVGLGISTSVIRPKPKVAPSRCDSRKPLS